ncbi:hypothetical protein MFIFM68171_11283 [Madurella fahalii]|uniref:Arrestin C-terminal-like domain-containing protein n=1 Tax=Madurella fahalii TaxID=1157608 RepID=A0ABQ0GTK1_9PEZI
MALPLDTRRHSSPPDLRPHRWVSSPSAAGALHLISGQHRRAVAGHTLHPLSAYSIPHGPDLLDLDGLAIPFMPGCCPEHDRLHPRPYFSSGLGSVYYSPSRPAERGRRADSASFPVPLIQPRQRRPHSIHIISYPAGFVPRDLRPVQPGTRPQGSTGGETRTKKIWSRKEKKEEKERKRADKERSEKKEKRRSLRSLPPGSEKVSRVLDKIFAAFSITPKSPPAASATSTPQTQSRPSSFISFARRLSRIETAFVDQSVIQGPMAEPLNMAANPIPRTASSNGTPESNRNSIISVRSAKTTMSSSVSEIQRPVASGSGLTCSILLAEPNVFLDGFDHDHRSRRGARPSSALLRGKLQLNVSKNVKIKSVILKLVGKARTEWPEGIPPLKTETFQEQNLRTQTLVFFQAMHEGMWETEYGMQCTFTPKSGGSHHGLMHSLYPNNSNTSLHILGKSRNNSTLTAKELKRLSLQSVKSRSFGKGDSPFANQVQAKGYKVFRPGTYEYAFELPIDHNQPETAKLQYGSVRWELQTTVERAGAFKPNLHGSKEVPIVRLPDQMSLETTEPISISRHWEDQLYYDIMISGKSFPIGAKIPIAFKLTPLAKVQIHKLKVFVTESIEYWTNDRHVTRRDPGRKILLLEKAAGKPLDKQFAASEIRVLSGGELDPAQREEARRTAARRRMREAARTRGSPEPLPEPSENLLGDLDLGLETFWGSTEIEMNVQLPTCETMARDKTLRLHPDCSWKNVNVFHWIKIVMRISRADPDDPTGRRRRHFEISIDSPFTVLNCRATQANTSLPQYSGRDGPVAEQRQQMSCGCPDAQPVDQGPAGAAAHLPLIEEDAITPGGSRLRLDCSNESRLPSLPRAAHLQSNSRHGDVSPGHSNSSSRGRGQSSLSPMERDRPIHLLRYPSHNPPAFDADEPPPPPNELLTPPPRYEMIVGTPSVDGLADYFVRLAAYENTEQGDTQMISESGGQSDSESSGSGTVTSPTTGLATSFDDVDPFNNIQPTVEGEAVPEDNSSDSAEEDDGPARPHRRGRVNVANPRTPGGRLVPSRSLDIERPVVRLDMTAALRRRNEMG